MNLFSYPPGFEETEGNLALYKLVLSARVRRSGREFCSIQTCFIRQGSEKAEVSCMNCGISCHVTHETTKGRMCATCHQFFNRTGQVNQSINHSINQLINQSVSGAGPLLLRKNRSVYMFFFNRPIKQNPKLIDSNPDSSYY